MLHDHLWYLATPYTRYPGGHQAAFLEGNRISGELLSRRVEVFSPIAHFHPIYEAMLQTFGSAYAAEALFWNEKSRRFLGRGVTTGLLIARMDGWDKSRGIGIEYTDARCQNLPIFTLDPVTFSLDFLTPEQIKCLEP